MGISAVKITAFKTKINQLCTTHTLTNEVAFIKKLNQRINGFGHYYKCGHVSGVFDKLDSYIRSEVRDCYQRYLRQYPSNSALEGVGLRSLKAIFKGNKPVHSKTTNKVYTDRFTRIESQNVPSTKEREAFLFYLEKISHQNAQIIGCHKAVLKELKLLNTNMMGM